MTGGGENSADFKQKAALCDLVVTFLYPAGLTEDGSLNWELGDQGSRPVLHHRPTASLVNLLYLSRTL